MFVDEQTILLPERRERDLRSMRPAIEAMAGTTLVALPELT